VKEDSLDSKPEKTMRLIIMMLKLIEIEFLVAILINILPN
jgi:hypothetical protein